MSGRQSVDMPRAIPRRLILESLMQARSTALPELKRARLDDIAAPEIRSRDFPSFKFTLELLVSFCCVGLVAR